VAPTLWVTCGRPGQDSVHRRADGVGRSAEVLAPLVAEVLAAAGVAPAALGGIACVRGPGSFTGIRVALATALGLSLGSGVPMAGLELLPLLAATAAAKATGAVVAITHARAGSVYLQAFLADGETMPMGPTVALPLAEAASRAAEAAAVGPLWLVGEGASRHRDLFLAAAPMATILGPEYDSPSPAALLAAAATAAYGATPIQPLYLRPSDAEENLDTIAASRGLSHDSAMARIRRAMEE
jgi:tRNA threonylcarbamoyl adenosine modification protein YeaZ